MATTAELNSIFSITFNRYTITKKRGKAYLNCDIHIEVGVIRRRFNHLQGTLPISYLYIVDKFPTKRTSEPV